MNHVRTVVAIELVVPLDVDRMDELAARRGVSMEQLASEISTAIENQSSDGVRWIDGVHGPGIRSRLLSVPVVF